MEIKITDSRSVKIISIQYDLSNSLWLIATVEEVQGLKENVSVIGGGLNLETAILDVIAKHFKDITDKINEL